MFPKFAIGIPTLNRWDLLRPTLNMYLSDFPNTKIFVCDNGDQKPDIMHNRLNIYTPPSNMGVAGSWNYLCERAFMNDCEFALILNDDIYLGRKEHEIGNYLHYQKGGLFVTMKDWCAFAIAKKTFTTVGYFDPEFKAYYEDNDYEYRLKMAGMSPIRSPWLTPDIYRSNGTGDNDKSIYNFAHAGKVRYKMKWGGLPGGEIYKTPFNKK